MKVGFIAPMGLAGVNGGVRTQATQTAQYLKEHDISVDFISPWDDNIDCDLAHVFIAGPGTIGIMKRLSERNIRAVLSPIFFSNRSAAVISTSLSLEKKLSVFGSGIRSEFGIKAECCTMADLILPNTLEEAVLIEKGFGISSNKIVVVPNGVEERFADSIPAQFTETYGLRDFVLFAGQAGSKRKNVKALLLAAPHIEAPVVIIGSFFDDEYGRECLTLAEKAGNVTLIGTLDHQDPLLASAYAACETFILPSQFETPGIAAMEAALAGAKIVITERGGTRDYFKVMAEYITPESVDSIIKAVNQSLNNEPDETLKTEILSRYTWPQIASQTVKAYQQVLN